jgi:hypothetical protein
MNKERVGSLLFLFVGGYGVALSIHLPMGKPNQPGAGVFPLAISILLIVTGALVFIGGKKKKEISLNAGLKNQIKAALIIVFTGSFIIALERLGYLLTACLYLLGLFRFVSGLKWWWSAILAATLALGSWYLFGKILGVQLPIGYWRLLL